MFTEHVQSRVQRRQETHDKVTATAERLFIQQGFAATTIRQIAVEARVSTGTVMAVGDKNGLLVAIVDRWIAGGLPGIGLSGEHPHDTGNPAEQILAIVCPFVELFAAHLELARAYAAVLVTGSHGSTVFDGLAAALQREIAAALEESGSGAAEAAAVASTFYFAYLGVLLAWAGDGTADPDFALAHLERVAIHLIRSERGVDNDHQS